MAEGEDAGWWRSWLQQSYQAVKEKSTEALEFMKRDLAEFTQVVQHDTACTIAATASVVKDKLARTEGSSGATEKVRKGISDFLGVISNTFAPSPDKTIDCDVITLMATPSGTTEPYDSAKARLYSLQSDPATYCNEPDGPAELLEAWLSQFNLEEKKGEIAELLATSPSIRALYTKMVPAAVSHSEFWQRYFYKVHRLEQDEARREALKQRAEQSIHREEPSWEEDEEEFLGMSPLPCANVTLPEAAEKECASAAPEGRHPTAHKGPSEESWAVLPPEPAPAEGSPSESSESVSLVTQIANPASVPAAQLQTGAVQPAGAGDLSQELVEATSEEQSSLPKPSDPARRSAPTQESAASSEQPAATELKEVESKAQARTETLKEEGPSDLRVFELNSDSGKSTPSNNGKKGSSTDISEDWEKDFDLDMTEEEVQLALSKVEMAGELEDEEWEDWE
ncbi:BSD domain-containing protein 1 [Pezoporus wallicus]|uniref:BSD domain-containing protein 1 n=1 Tax=Pezoporus wallicus TaxID=35540 RepID=UPI00254EE0AC|nr:BSD domain-containing protein 1 [Pezoporus wallicus]XP_061336362.1 BSD domain-containing protein 1 [Pezoporus flaviventris]